MAWRFRLIQGTQWPPEVNFLHSCAVVLSKFSGRSTGGDVKAYKKGKGLAPGYCPSPKNAEIFRAKRNFFF